MEYTCVNKKDNKEICSAIGHRKCCTYYNLSYRNIYMIHTKNGQKRLKMTTFHHHYCVESLHRICVTKVVIDNSRGEVSLLEQDTIENVS